ncbi:hypothetical protein BIW11_04334 [Tropilaelaps mercedesae]|uniref:Uncharacterized protein n=1 Tax=Tropilaelaps mercedesae TaxID=418985 RepID=A0A1V9X878_9ACAR|nr:hypothetical protein BIW11_04334 [Tropilaelaps mercedesae]
MDTAASNVHQCTIKLKPPKKIPTPYGGRLVWTMPGKNKFIVHLKDKNKIRHSPVRKFRPAQLSGTPDSAIRFPFQRTNFFISK